MSWNPTLDPACPDADPASIETVIVPRARDIGGFEVRRALPAPRRQMVGPFIFFDAMGPVEFLTGAGIDLRPQDARVMALGGETLGGPRYIWWNFVASSRDRIEAAKAAWQAGDWEHGRFRLPPGDQDEFIPLPLIRAHVRRYSRRQAVQPSDRPWP